MTSMITHDAAIDILKWLHLAEDDLVGATVVTFNCEAGTVQDIRLDDLHGLCFTFEEKKFGEWFTAMEVARSWYPVSTIRMRS